MYHFPPNLINREPEGAAPFFIFRCRCLLHQPSRYQVSMGSQAAASREAPRAALIFGFNGLSVLGCICFQPFRGTLVSLYAAQVCQVSSFHKLLLLYQARGNQRAPRGRAQPVRAEKGRIKKNQKNHIKWQPPVTVSTNIWQKKIMSKFKPALLACLLVVCSLLLSQHLLLRAVVNRERKAGARAGQKHVARALLSHTLIVVGRDPGDLLAPAQRRAKACRICPASPPRSSAPGNAGSWWGRGREAPRGLSGLCEAPVVPIPPGAIPRSTASTSNPRKSPLGRL